MHQGISELTMTLNAQISRPTDGDLHIVALLSTERGRRSAVVSSIQCLLSVVGSMGIILLFAGIPQLIYSPVVTATNVVIFLVGALLLSVMVAGNACISYRFRTHVAQITGPLSGSGEAPVDDKPPNYEDLSLLDTAPPDYYSVMCRTKTGGGAAGCASGEIAPTHTSAADRRGKPSSREASQDSLWNPIASSEIRPPSASSSVALFTYPEVLDTVHASGDTTDPPRTDCSAAPPTGVPCSMRSTHSGSPIGRRATNDSKLDDGSESTSSQSPAIVNCYSRNNNFASDSNGTDATNFSEVSDRRGSKWESYVPSQNSERSFSLVTKLSGSPYSASATEGPALPS